MAVFCFVTGVAEIAAAIPTFSLTKRNRKYFREISRRGGESEEGEEKKYYQMVLEAVRIGLAC